VRGKHLKKKTTERTKRDHSAGGKGKVMKKREKCFAKSKEKTMKDRGKRESRDELHEKSSITRFRMTTPGRMEHRRSLERKKRGGNKIQRNSQCGKRERARSCKAPLNF